jgi:hypothetical protein
LNRIRNELGVLLDNLFDLLLLQVFKLVLLKVETELSTTTERRVDGVWSNGEGATGSRLPNVLLVVVMFRDDLDTLGDQIPGVETDTELTDHGNISPRAQGLHKALQRRH